MALESVAEMTWRLGLVPRTPERSALAAFAEGSLHDGAYQGALCAQAVLSAALQAPLAITVPMQCRVHLAVAARRLATPLMDQFAGSVGPSETRRWWPRWRSALPLAGRRPGGRVDC
jgi:hypothetical protein